MKNASSHPGRTLAAISAAFVLLFALSACNTIGGAGKDIKAGGGAIEGSAEKHAP